MSCSGHESLDPQGRYSAAIGQCADLIRGWGFHVELFAHDLPKTVAGRTDYEGRWVKLAQVCAGCAFLTMAHEAGHVLSFKLFGKLEELDREVREWWAYFLGWGVVCYMGMQNLVPLDMWREHHDLREPSNLAG